MGDCFWAASGGVKPLPVNGGRLGRRVLPQGPCCQQGLAALMGVNEMMEGPELAGLPGLVPMVGGEDVVSTNVMCCRTALGQPQGSSLQRGHRRIRAELPRHPRRVSAEPIFAISLPAEYSFRQ